MYFASLQHVYNEQNVLCNFDTIDNLTDLRINQWKEFLPSKLKTTHIYEIKNNIYTEDC